MTLGPAEQKLRTWVLSELAGCCDPRDLEEFLQSGRALPMDDAVSLAREYLD